MWKDICIEKHIPKRNGYLYSNLYICNLLLEIVPMVAYTHIITVGLSVITEYESLDKGLSTDEPHELKSFTCIL